MTTVQQAIADLEMTLPEVITGHVDGAALPVKKKRRNTLCISRARVNSSRLYRKMTPQRWQTPSSARGHIFRVGPGPEPRLQPGRVSFGAQQPSSGSVLKLWGYWNVFVRGYPPLI